MTPGQHSIFAGLPGPVNPVAVQALTPDERLRTLRSKLMHGFGPGASEDTVMAFTRDREVVGGRLTVVGLEELAAHTARARGDTTNLLGQVIRSARKTEMVLGVVLVASVRAVSILRRRHHRGL